MQSLPTSQETVATALAHVVEAGQQIVVDRIELALIEGRQLLSHLAVSLIAVAFGGLVLLGGLITLDVALVDLQRPGQPGCSVLFYCAAVHGVIGAALLVTGLRRLGHRR